MVVHLVNEFNLNRIIHYTYQQLKYYKNEIIKIQCNQIFSLPENWMHKPLLFRYLSWNLICSNRLIIWLKEILEFFSSSSSKSLHVYDNQNKSQDKQVETKCQTTSVK
jgi:hypothetical protein